MLPVYFAVCLLDLFLPHLNVVYKSARAACVELKRNPDVGLRTVNNMNLRCVFLFNFKKGTLLC